MLIMTSSAIGKIFEIYSFYENRTEICIFFENRTEICTFFENRTKIYFFSKIGSKFTFAFCSKIGPKISNILSMADEVTIRMT